MTHTDHTFRGTIPASHSPPLFHELHLYPPVRFGQLPHSKTLLSYSGNPEVLPLIPEMRFSKGLFREKYDLCVSRAVANMATLSEYCLPFVKVGGRFIPYKSEKIEEEAAAAKKAFYLLGGEVVENIEFNLPYSDIYRSLFIIRKKAPTPGKYPRKAGLPAKEPIS